MFFALEDGKPTVVMQVLLTGDQRPRRCRHVLHQPGLGDRHHGDGADRGQRRQLRRRPLPAPSTHRAARSLRGLVTASRVGVAAAVAGVVAWGVTLVLDPITGAAIEGSTSALKRMFASALEIGLVGLVFGVIYLGIAHAMHVREVRQVGDMVRQRLGR